MLPLGKIGKEGVYRKPELSSQLFCKLKKTNKKNPKTKKQKLVVSQSECGMLEITSY